MKTDDPNSLIVSEFNRRRGIKRPAARSGPHRVFVLFLLSALNLQPSPLHAQGTAFTYQGRLDNNGSPANGIYDFRFQLASDTSGSNFVGLPEPVLSVPVSNGLFTATVDFGGGAFNGSNYWLALAVRTNNALNWTALTPLQPLAPAPYAVFAHAADNLSGTLPTAQLSGTLASGQLGGTYSGTVAFTNAGNSFSGSGTGLSGVNAATLGGLGTGSFWQLGGNGGTTAGASFVGTTDNQPLEFHVNGQRALRLQSTPNDANHSNIVNVVGGSAGNSVSSGVIGATIAGGGAVNYYGNYVNRVTNSFGSIGGGRGNVVSFDATVGGGSGNIASSPESSVGGGDYNTASGGAATVSGGDGNTASGNPSNVGGGSGNIASGSFATVPGGGANLASGDFSFAAGYIAEATNTGAFVWADSQGAPFSSTSNNQFLIRARGGVGINTNSPRTALQVAGTITADNFAGSGAGLSGLNGTAIATGTISDSAIADSAITGGKIATGQVVKSLNGLADAVTLSAGANVTLTTNGSTLSIAASGGGGTDTNAWSLTGNAGTSVTNGNFLGTTDNQPLELWVNNQRALRLAPDGSGTVNIIEGAPVNSAVSGVTGSTIGGGTQNTIYAGQYQTLAGGSGNSINGGLAATICGGQNNLVTGVGDHSAIGGGQNNTAGGTANTIGGGAYNTTGNNYATVGGGSGNNAGNMGTVGGGQSNTAGVSATVAGGVMNTAGDGDTTVGGGYNNSASGVYAVVGGGNHNTASGQEATIPGGNGDLASGASSFAAGTLAQAVNSGAFVWADSQPANFSSTATNEFAARATGGVRFVTAIDGSGNPTAGVSLASGGTSWATISDRNAKKDFAPVNTEAVLDKLAAVPVEQWHYKWEPDHSTPNIGPMAQDFIHTFYPGRDDKHITTLEFDGVELAAIQGLNDKVEIGSQKSEVSIQKLETENAALKRQLSQLTRTVNRLNQEINGGAR